MKKAIMVVLAVLVSGCDKAAEVKESGVPMLQGMTGGPWPVETYSGQRVQIETAGLVDGGQMEKNAGGVYLDEKSRFVLRDGAPIKTVKGDDIYWNSNGVIITKELKRVQESSIFSVGGRPMAAGTPMVPVMPTSQVRAGEKADGTIGPNANNGKEGRS